MSKARDLANLISSGSILSDGTLASTEIDGVTASAAELNILDGVTSTTAELNVLDGVTSTAAELNILDGVTSTAAELNILDGVTSTATELNILDGVTSTTAELNILDGVTSTTAELNILDGVTSSTAELNILDGVTSTTAELNILDGVTSTTAELNILDGVTSTAAELNILDGVTANATEINKLDALSRGSILYGDSSGATAILTKGTADQVLKSDGTDIAWGDAASGGGMTFLQTLTISNAASYSYTLPTNWWSSGSTTYKFIRLLYNFQYITPSGSVSGYMRIAGSSSSDYDITYAASNQQGTVNGVNMGRFLYTTSTASNQYGYAVIDIYTDGTNTFIDSSHVGDHPYFNGYTKTYKPSTTPSSVSIEQPYASSGYYLQGSVKVYGVN